MAEAPGAANRAYNSEQERQRRAKESLVCPECEGYGGGDEPKGHENSACEGTCPECWCPGCHDGQDFPESRLSELPDGDPCGSWLAYELIHLPSQPPASTEGT